MKEVEIVCLGDTAHIVDLGLKMQRGARVTTTLTRASESRDLAELKQLGVVAVVELKAHAIRRDFPPAPRQAQVVVHAPQAPIAPTLAVPASSDMSTVLLREILGEIRALRADLRDAPRPQLDLSPLTQALQGLTISAVSAPSETPAKTRRANALREPAPVEEERYIPSGIVPTDLKSEIATQDSVSENSSLSEAEGLLRQARKGAKKRVTSNGEE